MDNKRLKRGRPKKTDLTLQHAENKAVASLPSRNKRNKASPNRLASSPRRKATPQRVRVSPIRKSSRAQSRVGSATVATIEAAVIMQSPADVDLLGKTPTKSIYNQQKSKEAVALIARSFEQSPYTISTKNTTELTSSINSVLNTDLAKITEYIRRSVSRTFSSHSVRQSHTPTTTEQSCISRSLSRSVYDYDDYEDDDCSKLGLSDNVDNVIIDGNRTSNVAISLDVQNHLTSKMKCRSLPVPKEFLGLWGSCFSIFAVPPFIFYLQWCCAQPACELKTINFVNFGSFKYIEKAFRLEVVEVYLAFVMAIFLLSAIMFGRYERLPTDRPECKRHFNGWSIGLLTTAIFFTAELLNYPFADYVIQNYLRFCIYGIIYALITAFWCYLRANYAAINVQSNPYGATKNFIIDYALGKQINPKWFGFIEIKQVFYRISLMTTLLLAEIYIYKNIQIPIIPTSEMETSLSLSNILAFYYRNARLDTITLLSAGMLLCYILDNIIFEYHLTSSFELQHEGVGAFLLLRYAASPFLLTSVTKYFNEHKAVVLPNWLFFLTLTVFLFGLYIKRLSCNIKYKYRVNPVDPYFENAESIHTFEGRRLLLDRFWGCVRQPNYTGDILALTAMTLPLFARFVWPPLISISILIVLLLHRAVRVSLYNASRYHSSWVRYCSKVRYYIIPKIY